MIAKDISVARTQRLLERYLGGDKDAERQLFDTLGPHVADEVRAHASWKRMRRRVPVAEVVSDVWLRMLATDAFQRFEYQGPGSLRRFAARFVDRALIDRHRRSHAAKREGELSAVSLDGRADGDQSPIEPRSPDPTPSAQVSAAEQLRICDEKLDEPERTVARMCHEGFTHDEIGKRTGLTVRQVKSAMERARAKLTVMRRRLGISDDGERDRPARR